MDRCLPYGWCVAEHHPAAALAPQPLRFVWVKRSAAGDPFQVAPFHVVISIPRWLDELVQKINGSPEDAAGCGPDHLQLEGMDDGSGLAPFYLRRAVLLARFTRAKRTRAAQGCRTAALMDFIAASEPHAKKEIQNEYRRVYDRLRRSSDLSGVQVVVCADEFSKWC